MTEINHWFRHTIRLSNEEADALEVLCSTLSPLHPKCGTLFSRDAQFTDGRYMTIAVVATNDPAGEKPWVGGLMFEKDGHLLGHIQGSRPLDEFTLAIDDTEYTVEVKRPDPKPHNEDENGNYRYGYVEDFGYIANHLKFRIEYVLRCMRFHRSEDKAFARAALEYFHPESGWCRSEEALDRMIERIPDQGEWRQGASTHQLAIWPKAVDKKQRVWDGYWGEDSIQVGDFQHGCFTWFCIMAYAFAVDARRKRQQA